MKPSSSAVGMLAYKAWRESRSRFLIAVACVAGLCAAFILAHPAGSGQDYLGFEYRRIYGGFVRGLFLYLVLILGLGGLHHERAQRTIGFTLALPVTRWQLFGSRALVGLAQVVMLSVLPALLVPLLSRLVGHAYPAAQAMEFALLWVVVGWTVFAFAVLVSAVVRNEYAALATALVAFYLYPLAVVYAPFLRGRPLHIHYIMNGNGMPYFDPHTSLLVGPPPWRILALACAVAAAFLAGAGWLTTRQEA